MFYESTWDRFSNYYTQRCFGLTGAVDMLVFIFAVLIVFYSVASFSKRVNTLKRVIWVNVLRVVVHAAVMYGVWLLVGGLLFIATDIDLVINYVPKLFVLVAYVIFLNRGSVKARIISAATLFTINIVLIEVGGSLTGVLNAASASSIEEYIRAGITALTLVVAVFLRVWDIDRYKEIPLSTVIIVLIYSAIGFALAILRSEFMSYFNAFEGTENYEYSYYIQLYATIALAVIVLFNLACYFLIYYITRSYERNNILHRSIAQMENREAMERISEENYKQLRSIRHDMKNRYAIMQGMLDLGQYEELRKYFREMNKEAAEPLSQVNSGNISLDLALNLEISKAVAYGIETDTRVIVPETLPVPDLDMDKILTNLLDNAIEACQKIETGKKNIKIDIETVHDTYLVMEISNTVREDRLDTALSLETDKPDKKMHGLGSKIVDGIVAKYKGQINRSIEDGRFVVKAMLDMSSIRK